MPQDLQLVEGTVREVIGRFGDTTPQAVETAARLAGVDRLIRSLPQGYDTMLGAGEAVLSGGQRQRLALARALYGDPAVLVLDEPDASLDHDGDNALSACLQTLKTEGRAIIVISHRPGLVRQCDNLVELVDGQVKSQGGRDEVLRTIQARLRSVPLAPSQSEVPETMAKVIL